MSNVYFQQPNTINVGMGINIFKTTTSKGIYNIGIGGNIFTNNVSSVNTVGINNLGLGGNIFVNNTIGTNNIGIGGNVFGSNVTGNYNTGVGINSGNSILGSYNTMVGSNTGQRSTDGNMYNNSTALGYGAVVNASNQIVLGTTAESVVIPSITPSSNITSGALVVPGGVGIGGNAFIGAGVFPLQYIETVYNITPSWSGTTGTLNINYNNGLLYWLTTGNTGTITTLNISNFTSFSNTSMTFSFVMNTTSSVGYISTGSIAINGTNYTAITSILQTTPTAYILQSIHVFNINGTIQNLIMNASFY
jgi:hypothetical protein